MSLGIWELLILLIIVLLIFGAGKLPKVMGDLAKGIKSFKTEMAGPAQGASTPSPAADPAEPAPSPLPNPQPAAAYPATAVDGASPTPSATLAPESGPPR